MIIDKMKRSFIFYFFSKIIPQLSNKFQKLASSSKFILLASKTHLQKACYSTRAKLLISFETLKKYIYVEEHIYLCLKLELPNGH